jgi:hypothetical protein
MDAGAAPEGGRRNRGAPTCRRESQPEVTIPKADPVGVNLADICRFGANQMLHICHHSEKSDSS